MRLFVGLLPIVALALSACGDTNSVEAKNESVASVAGKVAASEVKPRPGRWQGTFKLESMEMTGMPPQAREAMKKSMGAEQTYFTCLTPEQAMKPDASFFQKSAPGCVYNHFSMAGGKLDAKMTCPAGNGPTEMTMAGTYGETDYDLKITGKGELQKGMAMNMSLAIAMHRVGECNGTEQ
jgi:hypothetical protein